MKSVMFLTSNQGKIDHANRAMNPFGIRVEGVITELVEGRSDEPKVIVHEKLEQARKKLNVPLIVEDSGFFIRALKGFPRTQIHFTLVTIGVSGIIKLMEGVEDRHCEFRYALGFSSPDFVEPKVFEHIEPGKIAQEVRPAHRETWTDLWKVYIPGHDDAEKTLSEFTEEELARHREWFDQNSHWRQFAEWYAKQ